jgi:hypothetical protein
MFISYSCSFIGISSYFRKSNTLFETIFSAQRLAAQPLGRFRYVVTILTGNL